MFISAQCYEELYLDGKDEKAIFAEVEKIRREIAKLKQKMESPSYRAEIHPYPSEGDTVAKYREYLERALDKLSDIREGESIRTPEEERSRAFNGRIDRIAAVTLTQGRYLQYKHELSFEDGTAYLKTFHLDSEPTVKEVSEEKMKLDIEKLYLGEWKSSYSYDSYGFAVNDATRWQLRIDYFGKINPVFFDGVGIFPYNFDDLLRLLEAEMI